MSSETAELVWRWANWTLVGALVLGVVATYAIVVSGRVRDRISSERIAEARAEAANATLGLAKAQTDIAASNAVASQAQADAAASNAVGEAAKAGAAKAGERASLADQKAEAERLARVELEARIAPRRLTPAQQAEIASFLSPFQGKRVTVVTYALDVESAVLGAQLIAVMHRAGIVPIDNRASVMPFGGFSTGIRFEGDENFATALYNGFCLKTGLAGVVNPGNAPPGVDATILIGPKPPEIIK